MAWLWGALMPHPPIIIPDVGQGREQEAVLTLKGMEKLLRRLGASSNSLAHLLRKNSSPNDEEVASPTLPNYLLLLSPHQPYAKNALFINSAPSLQGSLGRFGAPHISCTLTTPKEKIQKLTEHLNKHAIPVVSGEQKDLNADHSAVVPLTYLSCCFPSGKLPPIIIANPVGLTPRLAYKLGTALSQLVDTDSWGLVASGDLSHRLTPNAPAGYNPAGKIFDEAVLEALKLGETTPIINLPPNTIENAGECGLRSVMTLLGLANAPLEIFSYEAPFGVGYCTALWQTAPQEKSLKATEQEQNQNGTSVNSNLSGQKPSLPQKYSHSYPQLARDVVRHHLSTNTKTEQRFITSVATDNPMWQQRAGCFVSIKTKTGALRGCMGTIAPTQENLGQEIIYNAITAATHDPRFPAMSIGELDQVTFSVDVLGTPEPVQNLSELDPEKWGVIVSKGRRRGLLLPALEGVSSVEEQLQIAAQKAGLPTWQGATIQRFCVTRHKE